MYFVQCYPLSLSLPLSYRGHLISLASLAFSPQASRLTRPRFKHSQLTIWDKGGGGQES